MVEPVHVRRRVGAVGVGERPGRAAEHDVGAERDERATARVVRVRGEHAFLVVGRDAVEVGIDRRRGRGQHRRLGPGEHRRLVAVGADDQRHPRQRPRAGGVDRMVGQQVDAIGQPVGKRRRFRGALQLHQAGRATQLPLRQPLDLGGAHAKPLQELMGLPRTQLTPGYQRQRGALGDGPTEQSARGGAGEQRKHRRGAGRLAERGHSIGVAPEGGDVLLDPAQCRHLVSQCEIVVEPVAKVAEFETAEHADPVGDVDHHHVSVRGQPRPVVELELACPVYECATGNPHHHRQRTTGVG